MPLVADFVLGSRRMALFNESRICFLEIQKQLAKRGWEAQLSWEELHRLAVIVCGFVTVGEAVDNTQSHLMYL